jgi:hypothetical protein
MNDKIKELAERAGFNVWQDEDWNPGDVIDWSCRYDDELEKIVELVVRECALTAGLMEREGRKNIGAQILDNFGVQ